MKFNIFFDDFSIHQLPTSNLLKDLQNLCKVEVIIIAAQVESIPEMDKPGLSESLANSIPKTCEMIIKFTEANFTPNFSF